MSIVAGAGVLIAGLWMLWGRRPVVDDGDGEAGSEDAVDGRAGAEPAVRGPALRNRFSEPTRLVIGVSLLLIGYHIAAWGTPDDWLHVKVPRERWWMLVLGIGAALASTVGIDRVEKRRGADEAERR